MKIIPAIDIKDGKVVRLLQGVAESQKVYSDSPVDFAKKWDSFGVEMIHVVDLDGAFVGRPKNLAIVKKIADSVKAKIELGGGIRDEATIKEALDSGVDKVVVGTGALDEKFLKKIAKEFGSRIVVGIDARDGFVFTRGWVVKTAVKAQDLARTIESAGVKTINYTDISKDGTLEGPNMEGLKGILAVTKMDVIASGGVSTIDDVKRLNEHRTSNSKRQHRN